ncbi:hypothetical protein C8Q70DRAFT_324832 [Cubamyces menziesii]|nr:hypothetical protein C8Q70DRAFT_324832 [Cubamyces menziesii]
MSYRQGTYVTSNDCADGDVYNPLGDARLPASPILPPHFTTMDTLPLEILQRIFTLACTDGSHTGIALSLASKSIRAASRTARFHSIALIANPRCLQSFLALYERECEEAVSNGEDKPRIRHLYMTFLCIDPRKRYYSSSSPSLRRAKAHQDTQESSKV